MDKIALAGVYAITNVSDGRGTTYVGSTAKSFRQRWSQHRHGLRNNKHDNQFLQRAWTKYGEESFIFTILEIVDSPDCVIEREQEWMDRYRAAGVIYNISIAAGHPTRGRHPTDEERRKMSERSRERWANKEYRARMSAAQKGRTHTEETKRKMSRTHKGKTMPAHVGRAVAKANSQRQHSEETRRKLALPGAKTYPCFRNERTGEIIFAGRNLCAMCRRHGLSHQSMQLVKLGRQTSHRGWALMETWLDQVWGRVT